MTPNLDGFVPIPGYERYMINPDGRIYSTIRQGRFVKYAPSNQGYPYATLMAKGAKEGKKILVHRLVARVFLPNPEGRETVNHINSDRADPRKENLEWATQKENHDHARRVGQWKDFGETHHNAKLKEEDIRAIRRFLADGIYHYQIAEKFNVCRQTITDIANRHAWGWLS